MSCEEPRDFSGNGPDGGIVVGIFGCGGVGSTTAFALLHSRAVGTVLMSDTNEPLERSATEDMSDAAYAMGKRVGRLSDENMGACDVVVVAAGTPQARNQGRMELLGANEPIVSGIADRLEASGFSGTAIVVTNPVDTLTDIVRGARHGYRVRSTGTMLDEIRLRRKNGGVGTVVGTHDDAPVAMVDGVRSDELTDMVRSCAARIIDGQGRTMYGIATVVRLMVEEEAKGAARCTW